MLKQLITLNRAFAWLLALVFALFIFSGYSWTRGFWNPLRAAYIHTVLQIPLIFLFLFHTFFSIRLLLPRWGVKPDRTLDALLLIAGISCFTVSTLIILGI